MKIILPIIVVFVISFILLFIWIYRDTIKEREERKANLFQVVGTASILALAPTVLLAIILFALFGSATILNTLFALHISKNQLMLLAVSLCIYLFTLDNLVEMITETIIGKNIIYTIILFLVRILSFYMIGLILGIEQTSNFLIATGVAFITLLIEIYGLYSQRQQ